MEVVQIGFLGAVFSAAEFLHATGVNVETEDVVFFGEFDGEGEADVAEADDGDFCLLHLITN